MNDITISIFKSFEGCVFPGDIEGYIIPVMIRTIFRAYTGVDNNNNPFIIALSYEGDLLVGFAEKGMDQPWLTLDSIVEMYNLNKKIRGGEWEAIR